MSEKKNLYTDFLEKIRVGIHEVSGITEVPSRKIRYWEEKGCIESIGEGSSRQFDLFNVKKIILIQELIDDGYSLDGATKKVNERVKVLQRMFDLVLPQNNKTE